MKHKAVEQQINLELADYFDKARTIKCPSSMKTGLYQRIGFSRRMINWRPVMAFCLVFVVIGGISWQQFSTNQKNLQAEQDMRIAMHYIEKIGFKAFSEVNSHGIRPAIIYPLSKTMAKI
ncbi:MAG: hypothetical protein L3J52_02970 [Proteobacteria bacterium]|nr:hypothetical protein [Pseudomonadota bacterium]